MRDDFITFFCPRAQADFPCYREEFASCLIFVGSNGQARIPEKERSEDPQQYWVRVKKALSNGGLLVVIRALGNSPKASVGIAESPTYEAPRKMLRLSIDRSPEWVELGGFDRRAVDVDLRLGDHLIVPANRQSEEVLDELVRTLKYLPQDCEMNVLNVIRRPSLEWRVARLEQAARFERPEVGDSGRGSRVASGKNQVVLDPRRSWWRRPVDLTRAIAICLFLCGMSFVSGYLLNSYLSNSRPSPDLDNPPSSVSLSPTSLMYDVQLVNAASPEKTVTLTNNGIAPIRISITKTGPNAEDFSLTHKCDAKIAKGKSCKISVTFTPIASGSRIASVSITENGKAGSQGVELTGIATIVKLSRGTLTFSDQKAGTTIPPQTITLTNIGATRLSMTKSDITGTHKKDFSVTHDTCGADVDVGGSCEITVTFNPSVGPGKREATLEVNNNGGGSPQTVRLIGAVSSSNGNKKSPEAPQLKKEKKSPSQDDQKQKPNERQ